MENLKGKPSGDLDTGWGFIKDGLERNRIRENVQD
jgi:hypothetical protein